MTEAKQKATPPKKRLLKKALKISLVGLALLLVLVVGAVIWLRGSSGASFVYGQIVKAAAASGLEISAETFEGPLPERLYIKNLAVADAGGPIARAEMVEVKLSPLALIRGTAHVPLINIQSPELLRLPPSSEKNEDDAGGEISLPVDIKIDRLDIQNGRMAAGALSSLGLATDELHFRAHGLADINRSNSRLNLLVDATEKDHQLLSLNLDLGQAEGHNDQLILSLKLDDRPQGFLSRLLEDEAWPGLNLDLQGAGPLNAWRAELDFDSAKFGRLKAGFDLAGASGRLWPDFIARPDWKAALTVKAELADDIQKSAGGLVGDQLSLVADASLNRADLNLDLALSSGGAPSLILSSQLAGTLSSGGGDFSLKALLEGLTAGGDSARDLPIALTADLNLGANDQTVENLNIGGEGLNLAGSFSRRPATGAVQSSLNLRLADGSPLAAELLALAGLNRDDYCGEVSLKADLDWQGIGKKAEGELLFSGRYLVWPDETLQKALGPNIDLAAAISGGETGPVRLKIKDGRAGLFSLSGQADVAAAEAAADSEFEIDINLAVADLAPLSPGLSGPLNFEISAAGRPVDLTAAVIAASPSLNLGSGAIDDVSIKLDGRGAVMGRFEGEALDLSGRLNLKAADSPGGPLSLGAKWALKESADGLTADLTDLAGALAGLTLDGSLSADLQGGQPRLEGSLAADVQHWGQLAALTGQPFSGSPAKLALSLSADGGRQSALLDFEVPGLSIGQGKDKLLSLQKTSLKFKGDDLFGQPDLDLELKMASGLAGPLNWQSSSIVSQAKNGRGDFAANLSQTRLIGVGGSNRDGIKLSGQYDLDGPVTIVLNNIDVLLAGGGLTVKEPVTVALGDELKISDFAVNFRPGGRLTGKVDLTPGLMVIAAKGDKIPFKAFKPFAGPDLPDGELQSLDLALSQGPTGLTGSLALKTSATVQKFKPVVSLNGNLKGGGRPSFEIEGKIDGGPGWKADGNFKASVPLSAAAGGGFPQPDMNGSLDGEVKFTGALAPLWQLAGQPDRSLKGLARLEAKIGGTLAKPVPTGTLYVAGGRYEDSVLGVLVNDITLEARSTRELPLKALLSAKDGKGGGLALEATVKNLDNPNVSAKGRMSRFSPTHRDDLVVYVSGDFGAEGPLDSLSLTSNLTVDHGELDLKIAAAAGSVPTLPISGADDKVVETSKGMRANLKINIPGRFFIRGSGLESEWRGNLTVGGFTSRPSLVGQLAPVRGYFTFAAKEFQFSGGDISFSGGTVPNLNLELTNNTPGLTAILRFGGNASKPTLTMESRPPYPEEEVLSHVLFGKSASTISRFEALQLASALNGLRNFGSDGFNALDTVRASLGLDVLRLGGANDDRERRASGMSGSMAQDMTGGGSSADGEQSDDITVEAGKYIADNVYVGVEHSGVGGPAVRLEVELRPSVSLEARTSTESSRIGLGWKKDY